MFSKKKIILIAIPVFLVLLFIVFPLSYQQDLKANNPEEYAKLEQKWADDKIKAEQEKIAAEKQEILDRQAAFKEREQDKLEKQESLRIEKLKVLPDSCYGVNSIETELYPTGEKCLELIDERIFAYCLAENNNNDDKAWGCFGQVYALMDRNCKGSDEQGMLSVSYEACFMYQMVSAYQKLIPNP